MSLINDLVLEVERRRNPAGNDRRLPLRAPTSTRHRLQKRQPINRQSDFLRPSMALIAVASICIAAFRLHGPEAIQIEERPLPTTAEESAIRPSVSAQAVSLEHATLESDSIHLGQPLLANRIHRLATEPFPSGVRLRIDADRIVSHQIREAGSKQNLEIILQQTQLDEPIGPLELDGTPIESFQTRALGTQFHLHLSLKDAQSVQERWVEMGQRAALLIDIKAVQKTNPDPNLLPLRELAIEPSAADQERRTHERKRSMASRILRQARSAKSGGRIDQAIVLYHEAQSVNPDSRAIALELASALVEADRIDKALVIIQQVRLENPKEQDWAMLHAKALAKSGDLTLAVAELDRTELNVRRAPDLHTLAAAYIQKAGDHLSALDRYESLVQQYPSRAPLWMGMGISLEALKRNQEAADVYQIAIEVGGLPSSSRTWVSSRVASLKGDG